MSYYITFVPHCICIGTTLRLVLWFDLKCRVRYVLFRLCHRGNRDKCLIFLQILASCRLANDKYWAFVRLFTLIVSWNSCGSVYLRILGVNTQISPEQTRRSTFSILILRGGPVINSLCPRCWWTTYCRVGEFLSDGLHVRFVIITLRSCLEPNEQFHFGFQFESTIPRILSESNMWISR